MMDGAHARRTMFLAVKQHGLGYAHAPYRRYAAPSCNREGNDRLCCQMRPVRRKPGDAGPCNRFIATLPLALRARAAAQAGVFLLASLLSAGTVLALTSQGAANESPQIADAFAELDALTAAIASRLQALTRLTGLPSPPPPPGPPRPRGDEAAGPPSPPPGTGGASGETPETGRPPEPQQCGTREDMASSMLGMDNRYADFKQTILAVNDDLATFRQDVLDIDKVCTPQVESSIASAINRLEKLEIDGDSDLAIDLIVCVDQRRRATEEKIGTLGNSTIRMQRLSDELKRLTDTTHRVQELERALGRAVSKRNRLVEELNQLRREIEGC